jgi:hypothetical protein
VIVDLRTFTVDKCTEGGIFETVNEVTTVSDCQFYCREIFAEKCKFFMLDFKQKVKDLKVDFKTRFENIFKGIHL